GEGRLTGGHTVEATTPDGTRKLESQFVLVATGSSPYRPPGIPDDDQSVHDADGILHLDHLPRSLVVIGGGVIGCEYACMFAALGVQVTLVEKRPRLLDYFDPEIVELLCRQVEASGVTMMLSDDVARVSDDDNVVVDLRWGAR